MKKIVRFIFVTVLLSSNSYSQPLNSFTAAFDSLYKELSTNYAFTEWKKVDWIKLNNEFRPRIVAAQTQNDSSECYLALRDFFWSIPDGHLGIDRKEKTNWGRIRNRLKDKWIGGSYGFTLIKLDDGRFVVKLITSGSPADIAGIKFGSEILEVNDKPIKEAINSAPILWTEQNPATKETKQLLQCRLIGRAPVGSVIKLKFKNRGEQNPTTKNFTAVNDNYKSYDLTSMLPIKSPEISHKILQPSGYGYLEITSCIPPVSIVEDFRSAFIYLLSQKIKGLILDLRINTGGQDSFAAAVAGCFYSDTTHYEYWSIFDPATKTFQRSKDILNHLSLQTISFFAPTKYPRGSIYIEPSPVSFTGPVVVMCSPREVSSGEGIAMALQKLPNCKVVSFYGSHGSFGVETEYSLFAPQDSFEVSYPYGRSLDVYNKIQVDSDADMIGGVIPSLRPPLTDQTIDQMYLQGIDVELNYAVKELDKMLGVVGIENETNQIPTAYSLAQNYPNPFNPATIISFQIPVAGKVELKVFDSLGREIAELVNSEVVAGKHEVKFDGSNLSSGVYFYQLKSARYVEAKKFVLMK